MRLRARRLDRNVSVDALAEAAGVNRKTILEIENGGDVKLSSLVKLLRHLNMLGVLGAGLQTPCLAVLPFPGGAR